MTPFFKPFFLWYRHNNWGLKISTITYPQVTYWGGGLINKGRFGPRNQIHRECPIWSLAPGDGAFQSLPFSPGRWQWWCGRQLREPTGQSCNVMFHTRGLPQGLKRKILLPPQDKTRHLFIFDHDVGGPVWENLKNSPHKQGWNSKLPLISWPFWLPLLSGGGSIHWEKKENIQNFLSENIHICHICVNWIHIFSNFLPFSLFSQYFLNIFLVFSQYFLKNSEAIFSHAQVFIIFLKNLKP